MFTGLIEGTGRIASFDRRGAAAVVRVETTLTGTGMAIGDSVAVNGVCLTVTTKQEGTLCFDASPESLAGTTLGNLRCGSQVNLERAMALGNRLGGHIVTGHVDCIARLARLREVSGNRVLEFTLPPASARYLVTKGSVAIDGISLTVNTVTTDGFSVNIIPHTFAQTTLAGIVTGQEVNIETDIIGKYVERLVQPWKGGDGLTMKTLAENGFL
ncbi:riboflavin synthase [Geobacter sp. SVR]|uniref:riboflavin synthase n=1 Tax=Geobacter sp. SVR TaxID=2495594 RepID=UPI00143EFF1C|nr:riboflavin synthase [Geobacter sp. SVR]BCS53718.1 riboflavin synthase subunit alpha [Geobacter sp. SVR]GCF85774.1 riboflavin synthase subunit alpha [Geobacter sp. SVR]